MKHITRKVEDEIPLYRNFHKRKTRKIINIKDAAIICSEGISAARCFWIAYPLDDLSEANKRKVRDKFWLAGSSAAWAAEFVLQEIIDGRVNLSEHGKIMFDFMIIASVVDYKDAEKTYWELKAKALKKKI